jgi:hypothetical protein
LPCWPATGCATTGCLAPTAPGEGRGARLGWAEPSARGAMRMSLGGPGSATKVTHEWEHTRRPGAATLGYPTGLGRSALAARRSRRRWM